MPVPVTDANRLPLHTASPGITSSDTEVILILDAASAQKLVDAHFRSDDVAPEPTKLFFYQRLLGQSPQPPLQLPIIYYNTRPNARFSDGRHRTTVLIQQGNKTVPVLTSQSIAMGLQNLWGSKQTAMNEYDFTNCKTSLILGL
ncbi:hypothetical protein C4K00_2924 [Pseudomonas synxantha]|uniref:hypothetical protein n=1 Tax=Pseudomonas synxantha TaxID=47883 RepID=UPI000F5615DD|nr:hypothetical protein [Pseudomonas synxantha]AZE73152.1 hypothetical protein C4K00_2924 [Pseudomonas synxantha]